MNHGGVRKQQTLEKSAELKGFGFFTGADASLRLLPADENHGVVFQRTDLSGQPTVEAIIANVESANRRTLLKDGDAEVQLVEHLMAAFAGLRVDNVLVQIDGPEVPGFDGSARDFCEAILKAGICRQTADVKAATICRDWSSIDQANGTEISVRPHIRRLTAITYHLDYGHRSPIEPQLLSVELTPDVFLRDISWSRTFVLESEVQQLRQAGFGTRVSTKDLLVFGDDGVLENKLRSPDECVRHKILDCVGDFALYGGDIYGHFDAWRSGHGQNHDVIRQVQEFASPLGSQLRAA
jgi:UDP-3-O-[3-hydroxymyristoyl] N-acetylglucosamine deacetylase/UDP-3-O-[3-hydroxymyristoyl] N-acetylglucosamine deacetylase/3-hydroxyacyl-[acyl-carrier-protein] dehydratase